MSTPALVFAAGVLKQIDERMRELDHNILQGTAPDYAAYKSAVGRLRGYEEIRAIIVASLGEEATPELKRRPSAHD